MKITAPIACVTLVLAAMPVAGMLGGSSLSSSAAETKLVPVSFREKTQARLLPAVDARGDRGMVEGMTRLAQAPAWIQPGPFPHPHVPPGPPPHGFGPAPFGFVPPPAPRVACEDEIDRLAGIVGYLKSKERLEGDQKSAWDKVETAAAPGLAKLRALCADLPSYPGEPPALPARVDFMAKQMTARAELLSAIREPLRALYDTLSPDQRALLDMPPPGPPPHPRGERL